MVPLRIVNVLRGRVPALQSYVNENVTTVFLDFQIEIAQKLNDTAPCGIFKIVLLFVLSQDTALQVHKADSSPSKR